MACESIQNSSSSQMISKYDVFVSFRGEDTRNNFTDHLFGALHRKGIVTFRDDTKLKKGESISSELIQAIEGSRILIVVFSKNYASSTWCLQELANMVDCIEVPGSGQSILPIFYDVDPSEVRKQSGNFGKAFVEHEQRFKEDLEMVQSWREALTKVGKLSGWDVQNKPQHAEIEKIVKAVIRILSHKILSFADDLVGMHSCVEQLEDLLDLGSTENVQAVGICGMGGIGKTTLATVLYDRISHQYDACCFIDDTSKLYRDYGAIGLQKQFLCQALNEGNLDMCTLYEATYSMRTRLRHIKALVVLDNVDQVEQLEKLAIKREWLGVGSRIIIISRDEHILKEYGVDQIYYVPLLTQDNSLKLFCRKAFRCDDIMRDYNDLAYDVLRYANGLPLAVKVLGSFLFGRDVFEWRSALARLKENPNKDIMDVLRISFDGLGDMDKEIFLDIACFFNRKDEQYVKGVLDCCGFEPNIGIRVLIDKSLIIVANRYIIMHDLLQELGRKIVQENLPNEPEKWSRLWLIQHLQNVTLNNTGMGNPKAIALDDEYLRVEALSKISRLRLLILKCTKFSGSLNCLSNELQYLEWHKYPFMYLPSSFQPDKLVELILPHSSIKQLWEGIKYLPCLRVMDLHHSKNLIKLPNFIGIPNLRVLNLKECTRLAQISPSVGLLRKLASLNLKNCKNLASIPYNILGLSSLEYLHLSGCTKVFNSQLLDKPRYEERLKKLDIRETVMQSQSTSSIYERLMLPLNFSYSGTHKDSAGCLLPFLPSFSCLRDLDLSFCNLSQIPHAIGSIHCLERLNLGGNNFVKLPCSLKELSKLVYLNLEHCKQLKSLPELPSITDLPITKEFSRRSGLYIFNCPKLAPIELCNDMALSWMIQVIQANRESFISFINIIIPESEIPRWINTQSVSSSMSIDLSPIVHDDDDNWIGIVCCAVFVALPTDLISVHKPSILMGFGYHGSTYLYNTGVLLDRDLVTVESDHLWLFYFTQEEFIHAISFMMTEEDLDLDSVKLATSIKRSPGLHLEVKSCGYRWVFKQDLEQLNPTMMRGGSSSSSILIDNDLRIGSPIQSLEAGIWPE